MSKRKKESSFFWEARLQSSRVWDAPVFKMSAESHLICPKPTWRGTTVNVSECVCMCVKEGEKRDINRAHCTTAYLIQKPFGMLCWGLCWIDGSAYRFKLQISSAESSPLSLRLTHNNNKKSAGNRLGGEFSCAYPAHKRYTTCAAISSMADSILHGLKTPSYCRCWCVSVTDKATRCAGLYLLNICKSTQACTWVATAICAQKSFQVCTRDWAWHCKILFKEQIWLSLTGTANTETRDRPENWDHTCSFIYYSA